jgi:hypothetical protein
LTSKACKKCERNLPISEFYVHASMGDGHLSFCKECVGARVGAHREANLEKIRIYDRIRGDLPHRMALRQAYAREHPEAFRPGQANWLKRNPEKRKAHNTLSNAIRDGKIVKPTACSKCDEECRPEGHHVDYSKPLEVVWLCRRCHAALSRKPRHVAPF